MRVRHLLVAVMCCVGTAGSSQPVVPAVAGISLGSRSNAVQAALGRPERVQESLGMQFWDYTKRGLSVIWRDGQQGVHGIVVTTPNGGDVAGVKIGDSEGDVRKAFGSPARVRQDGRFIDYVGADWVLSIELNGGEVVQMTLMRAGVEARRRPDKPQLAQPSSTPPKEILQ